MFVETVAACIQNRMTIFRAKEMMPMATYNSTFFSALEKAASFAAYTIALITTDDAGFATALHI